MNRNKTYFLIISATILSTMFGVSCATLQSSPPEKQAANTNSAQTSPTNPTKTNPASPTNNPTPPVNASPIPEAPANISKRNTDTDESEINTKPLPKPVQPVKNDPIAISPPTEGCKITTALISDPNPPLNVRSSPKVANDNIVDKLDNGKIVFVTEEKDGWLKITQPQGWISKNQTESSCPSVNQRINLDNNQNTAIVKGRIIGGGSHTYIINANQGQTITLKSNSGPLPLVFADSDTNRQKELSGGAGMTNKSNWSDKLPVTGDYILELDSNFQGFKYDFSIEIK